MSPFSTLPESDAWTALAEDWQAARPPIVIDAGAIRKRLETGRRWMVFGLIVSTLVTLGYLIGPALLLLEHPSPDSTFLAADSWVAIVAVWGFAIWSGRGTWKPLAETTEMFLELERRRWLARLRAARAGLVFVVIQFVSVGLWNRFRTDEVPATALPRVLLLLPAAVVVVVVVVAIRAHRQVPRAVSEIDRLLAELRRIGDPD